MSDLVRERVRESVSACERLLEDDAVSVIVHVGQLLVERVGAGGKLLVFGNGGSATQAEHMAAELMGRFQTDRPPLPAVALADNSASLTAIANDYAFDDVFARQVRGLAQSGDVVIGLSTSGNSANVIEAMEAGGERGAHTVALTGLSGGGVKEVVDHCICFPSEQTPRIQEGHELITHVLCEMLERSATRGS